MFVSVFGHSHSRPPSSVIFTDNLPPIKLLQGHNYNSNLYEIRCYSGLLVTQEPSTFRMTSKQQLKCFSVDCVIITQCQTKSVVLKYFCKACCQSLQPIYEVTDYQVNHKLTLVTINNCMNKILHNFEQHLEI